MNGTPALPSCSTGRMEPGQDARVWYSLLSRSTIRARPIRPIAPQVLSQGLISEPLSTACIAPRSSPPPHPQAINPAAGARRKGSPCRRREGERAWSSPHSSIEERSAPRRAGQRRRSRRRRPRPPARTAQGGHGAALLRPGRVARTGQPLRLHHAHGARRTELRGAAFGRPPMLFLNWSKTLAARGRTDESTHPPLFLLCFS